MAGKKLDPVKLASILAYDKEHGGPATCKRWKISPRTLCNYRRRRALEPALAATCAIVAEKVHTSWLEEARAARTKILARVLELAAKSENLREVVGALKIVSDSALAYDIVKPEAAHGGRAGNGAGMEEPSPAPSPSAGRGDPDRAVH